MKDFYRSIEYKMPESVAKMLLKTRKDKKKNPQQWLCDYVNSECGILGNCTRVILF